jgi:hypothetical protein
MFYNGSGSSFVSGRCVVFWHLKKRGDAFHNQFNDLYQQMYVMPITRYARGATAVLLYALLLQSCQSNSLSVIDKETPSKTPLQTSRRPPASEILTRPISRLSFLPLTTAPHHPKALPLLPGISLSAIFAGLPPSAGSRATAVTTPLHNTLTPASHRPFTASTGELVRFQQVGSQWQAVLQENNGSSISQRTLPVVGLAHVGNFLSWLQHQDKQTSRSRIHILNTPQSPYRPCVYLGKVGLLGGLPSDAGEDSKPPAKRQSSSPDDGLVQGLKKVRKDALEVFGAKEWQHYFGDVGPAPNLPSGIDTILDGPCPFWPGKKVKNTHLLVLVPATVDGAPFTLNLLGELIQYPKNGGYETKYRYCDDATKAQFGEKSLNCSCWLLMMRDVLVDSRNRTYADQRDLVARYATKTDPPYEVPGVLEVSTAILMHHARTGERLLGNDPPTYTRCRELVDGEYPAVVGGFDLSGLFICDNYFYASSSYGVTYCRRFVG